MTAEVWLTFMLKSKHCNFLPTSPLVFVIDIVCLVCRKITLGNPCIETFYPYVTSPFVIDLCVKLNVFMINFWLCAFDFIHMKDAIHFGYGPTPQMKLQFHKNIDGIFSKFLTLKLIMQLLLGGEENCCNNCQ